MRAFYLFPLLVLAAQPCRAMTADIIMVPEGKVEARSGPSSAWIQVGNKVRIAAGAEIRTGKESKAGVFLPDGSRFLLGNNTLFSVDAAGKKKAGFQLKFGRLKAAVAGYFSSRFEIKTPSAVCAVRGTEFDMDVAKDGGTEMNVSEGLVEVNDSKGARAVVSSEERIKIGMDGMAPPETISLRDERAGQAARPMAVRQETARERTRTMLEEVRNRELKANEAQLGKDSIDAFGKRVRIEEYLLRPSNKEFKLLFLSRRAEEDRLDWGHLIERFQNKIPDDISQVGAIIDGMYFSKTAPTNWMKYFEVYLTNTIDSVKETIDFGNPTLVDFSGYGAGVGSRYYPSSIDYKQILSGPGVPGGERTQFQVLNDYDSTTPGQFTWTQKVVNNTGALGTLLQLTLDPANATDVSDGYTAALEDHTDLLGGVSDPTIDPVTTEKIPSGKGFADYFVNTDYRDGSSVSSRKLLVSNEGDILKIPSAVGEGTFLKEGSYNLELVVTSNLFQGRNIDVLIAPEILTQKKSGTDMPNSFVIQ